MQRTSLVLSALVVTTLTGMKLSCLVKPSISAESRFSTTVLYWKNWDADQPWQPMRFIVPDEDTTISAYGGELRRYDVHVAKMFEVTHYLCQNKHKPNLFNWLNGNNVWLYRPSYAQLIAKCQQIKQRN